ncbi:MAG: putative bifunctional diguanylate cyclase/phosphodiesterase, partial [Gammaproteobacteria bacterium]
KQFRLTFDMAPVGIAHVDMAGNILHTNRSLTQLLEHSIDALEGMPLSQFLFPGETLQWDDIHEPLQAGTTAVEKETRFLTSQGDELWINLRFTLLRDAAGGNRYYIATLEDVTERKRAHQEMERIAFHDPLTGLPNRRLFNKLLADAISDAGKRGSEAAVFFLDLDHFKQVNDTLGHAAGDRLLQQASIRIGDALDEGSMLARLGGDEFAILMTLGADEPGVCAQAQRIVDSFTGSLAVEGHDIIVTPSIGISRFPVDGGTPEQLTKNADAAMYKAKEGGRNGYRVYNSAMTFHVAERMSLEQSLRRAQGRGELRIFYQPQCSVETGAMVAAEVLVRWEHPEQGLLPPERFIPLAEDTGLIMELGDWVFSSACDQIRQWSSQGVELVPIMVNLSLMQMRTDDVVALIRRVLSESEVDPRLVGIELTENIASLDRDLVIDMLNDMRGAGVKVVMDDFGSAYSSLNRLRHFPLDGVKIDKSFILDIARDPTDRAIVRSMVDLARTLDLSVVAEGVESDDQLQILRELSCDVAQGYLFGRPIPAADFIELLSHRDSSGQVYPSGRAVA